MLTMGPPAASLAYVACLAIAFPRQMRDLPTMPKPLIIRDSEILSGTPVFFGTRVPVKNLTDYLEGGDSIEVFLDDFPTVTREQVIAFLEEARERLSATAK